MDLRNRFRNVVNAARGADLASSSNTPKPPIREERGVSTGLLDSYIDDEVARTDDLSIEDYRRMRHNDSTIKALYQLFTLPLLASKWTFKPDDGGNKGSGTKETEFLTDAITRPPHKGGMTIPFNLFLKDVLRSVEDGYRVFYKVRDIDQDGRIVYHKLSPRDVKDLTVNTDDNGGLKSVRQRVYSKGKYTDVYLPQENLFMYTFQKEMSPFYGESLYKTAHYHYNRKRRFYVLQELQAQVAAIPPRKLGVPADADPDARTKAEMAADRFGSRQRITLPEGFTLEEYETNPHDVQKAIDHHDYAIARSVLAQFIMLGSGSTGSFALSRDHSDLLLMSLESLQNDIAAHFNAYLFPELIDYNFNSGLYPTFEFAPLSEKTKSVILNAFNEMVKKGDVPDFVKEGIVDDMAKELGIEIPDEDEARKAEEEADRQRAEQKKKQEAKQFSMRTDGVKLSRKLSEAENRVNLSAVKRKYDTSEETFKQRATEIITKAKDDATSRAERIVKAKGIGGLRDFKIRYMDEYKKLLKDTMNDVYIANKKLASDEINENIPQTPADTKEYFTEQADSVAKKTAEELLFIVKSEVAKEQRKSTLSADLSLGDAIARIASAFAAFIDSKALLAGTTAIATAMNMARQDVFTSSTRVVSYEYSAILDLRTSPMCRELDGMVLSKEQYNVTQWKPPIHFNCRSIWVAILQEDSFQPEVTGEVSAPAGYAQPLLSRGGDNLDYGQGLERLDYFIDEVVGLHKSVKKNEIDQTKLSALEKIVDNFSEA